MHRHLHTYLRVVNENARGERTISSALQPLCSREKNHAIMEVRIPGFVLPRSKCSARHAPARHLAYRRGTGEARRVRRLPRRRNCTLAKLVSQRGKWWTSCSTSITGLSSLAARYSIKRSECPKCFRCPEKNKSNPSAVRRV